MFLNLYQRIHTHLNTHSCVQKTTTTSVQLTNNPLQTNPPSGKMDHTHDHTASFAHSLMAIYLISLLSPTHTLNSIFCQWYAGSGYRPVLEMTNPITCCHPRNAAALLCPDIVCSLNWFHSLCRNNKKKRNKNGNGKRDMKLFGLYMCVYRMYVCSNKFMRKPREMWASYNSCAHNDHPETAFSIEYVAIGHFIELSFIRLTYFQLALLWQIYASYAKTNIKGKIRSYWH